MLRRLSVDFWQAAFPADSGAIWGIELHLFMHIVLGETFSWLFVCWAARYEQPHIWLLESRSVVIL